MKRVAAAAALLAAMVWCGGCDLFQTRDPESPTASNTTRTPPVTPDIVLTNLQAAIREHNTDNYMRCFVDTTIAGAPPFAFAASGDFQGIFRNWQLEDERRYFQNLGAPVINAIPALTFANRQEINRTSTTDEYTMDYLLYYPHQQQSITQEVRGYMHLYLQTDGQHGWSIYRWEDTRTVSDSTWSYLKAHF